MNLRECPFCGSSDIDADHGAWGVICNQCDATGPGRCHNDPSVWNTRAPDPRVAELEGEVERLREVLKEALNRIEDRPEDFRSLAAWAERTREKEGWMPHSPTEKEAGHEE